MSRDEFLGMFREDVIRLSRYIPWFEKKNGNDVSRNYEDGDKMKHTLSFPVYDSILLSFLNDASTTVFMEQNYHYFYTRNRIQNYEDELRLIETADIMHMDVLQCILSRYIFGGMTKAYLWKDGVDHKIFLSILKKARQIIEFWDQPLIIEDEILPEDEEEMGDSLETGYVEGVEDYEETGYVEEVEDSVEAECGEGIEDSEGIRDEEGIEEAVEEDYGIEKEEFAGAGNGEETEEPEEYPVEEVYEAELEEPAEAANEAETDEFAEPETETEDPVEAEQGEREETETMDEEINTAAEETE